MALYPNELVIDDDTNNDLLFKVQIDGTEMGTGAIERDDAIQPAPMLAPPSDMKLIPRSEWSDRIKEQEARKSRISDVLLRAGIPSTNQAQSNYCWAYSSGGCVQAVRAMNGQPFVPLNPHSVAAILMKGANRGGWCGYSSAFITENGIAPMSAWPALSHDYRKYDTPAVRAEMAKYRVTEDWIDLSASHYERQLSMDQIATCLLQNIPVALDFAWWSHSVMGADFVEVEPGSFGYRIRNSWTDNWGSKGFSVIQGSKVKTMGAIGLRVAKGTTNK